MNNDNIASAATLTDSHTPRYDVIVVGAGQAGLATGYYLQQRNLDFLILDANERVGDSWRTRWDSLQLFTPATYSNLPGYDFPADDPYYLPDKDDVADYFVDYATRFELPIKLNTRVKRVQRCDDGYRLHTSQGDYYAAQVVIASGTYHTPYVPDFADDLAPRIQQLHSSDYQNPSQIAAGHVLVVGAGSSGAQIALDLVDTHTVTLAGRDPGNAPREILGKDIYWWWYTTGIMDIRHDSWLADFIPAHASEGDARVGLPAETIHAAGIRWVERITAADDGAPVTANDIRLDGLNTVIWATGYRPNYNWIDGLPTDERGYPRHERGEVCQQEGLYFVGLPFQHRVNSSLLGGVGRDAQYIVQRITAKQPQAASA